MIQERLITTTDDFSTLAKPWNELVLATPTAHVFMMHEWFTCWINSRDTAPQLAIQTIWRDGQLVAIAPLQRTEQKFKLVNAQVLKFLQSPISPRCNFVARDQADARLLFQAVAKLPDWELLITENMESAQPITGWFTEYLAEQKQIEYQTSEGRQSPYLDISGTWEEYLKGLSRDRRTFIKSECLNRLAKAESFHFERFTETSDSNRALSLMLDISSRSWKQEEGTAIGQIKNQQRFYSDYTPQALRNGWVDLRVLYLNGTPAAFDYYLTYHNNYSLIRTDYDMTFKYYHPGENLKIDLLQSICATGHPGQLDMGGDSSLYKQKWASGSREHVTVTAGNATLFAKAVMLGKFRIIPALKKTLKG